MVTIPFFALISTFNLNTLEIIYYGRSDTHAAVERYYDGRKDNYLE